MPSSSTVLLFSAVFSMTSALPWNGPKATATYSQASWTPKPTQGSIPEHKLFGRGLFFPANTCGWIGGDYSSAVTCGSSSSCVWDTARSFVGCCPTDAPCSTGVYTGCVDIQSGTQTVVDPAVTTCSGGSTCYLNSFPESYYQYGCGSSDITATVETTFLGEPSTFSLQIVTTSLDIPAASTIAGAANSPASITSGSFNSGTSTAATTHSKKSSTPIIVGVVCGILGVGLLALVGACLLRRRRGYHRSGRTESRLEKSSTSKSVPAKSVSFGQLSDFATKQLTPSRTQASQAAFHRVSDDAPSPNPLLSPEMGIVRELTFPPPPESHKNPPAPRYFDEHQSPARPAWSPIEHVPPRFSPKRQSPFLYVPYIPRPKTPKPISPIISPNAYEPLRNSPKPIFPIAFTPIQESQREGQLIPLTPAFQAEMNPFAFLPNDEDGAAPIEPRQMSPVAFLSRPRAQSPTDAQNMARELTPSPSQQSLLQRTGSGRDLITPSPSGSQQPLLQSSQNTNAARELVTPSPTFQIPLEPVELPAPIPSKSKSPAKSKHRKDPSNVSLRAVTYTTIPPLQESPPRQARRKPVSKPIENVALRNSNQYNNHIALQLTGSPSQSLALKPKTSQASLKPKSSHTELNINLASTSAIGSGSALLASRAVSPLQKEEIAKQFRIKPSSPKNMGLDESDQATTANGRSKGSSEKIERILGFVTGIRSKGTKEKAVQIKRSNRHISSEYIDTPVPVSRPASPASFYGSEERDASLERKQKEKEKEVVNSERERKETASVCSANILDVGSEGMGTLPFTMEFDVDHWGQGDEGGKKEKGVKWRDEVASDGNIAESSETPPRLDTPLYGNGGTSEYPDEWSRSFGDWNWMNRENEQNRGDSTLPQHGQVWAGNSGDGNWL